MSFVVDSPNVRYTRDYIESRYVYETAAVAKDPSGILRVQPKQTEYRFRVSRRVPRVGCMLVGWGGNNGTTITGAVLANKLRMSWPTKKGRMESNYYGSVTQSSTVSLGMGTDGKEVFIPLRDLLPMVEPNDLIFDGWDISSMNIGDAMGRAEVFEPQLQDQLYPHLVQLKPRPSIYCKDFIAANQEDRADNVLSGTKWEMMDQLRADIRDFKQKKDLDKVIVLWTANTERFCDVAKGLNETADELLQSIKDDAEEVSPSTIFAVASILEGCAFVNGSPQNTLVPGVVDLAERHCVFVGGDDFKSGQTKFKSVLVDFLVSAGIKPTSIVSYNHLGNNDGKNLSAPKQFRSKEISKSNVVDDMVESNNILYTPQEKPDHCVVIKYVPYVGDSKRALDEYTSEIFMGGHNTVVVHNTCEDSLLAAPIILDLVLLTEVCQRITMKTEQDTEYGTFHAVLSILSYLLKAPCTPPGTPIVNALFKQRSCIENIFRACLGLPPQNHMTLEHRVASELSRRNTASVEGKVATVQPVKRCHPTNGHNGRNGTSATHDELEHPAKTAKVVA